MTIDIKPIKFEDLENHPKFQNCSEEESRTYKFNGGEYTVENPLALLVGNTTHRVIDNMGCVHICPNVGHNGCVVIVKPKNRLNPVQF